jgi:hypothetical protein
VNFLGKKKKLRWKMPSSSMRVMAAPKAYPKEKIAKGNPRQVSNIPGIGTDNPAQAVTINEKPANPQKMRPPSSGLININNSL